MNVSQGLKYYAIHRSWSMSYHMYIRSTEIDKKFQFDDYLLNRVDF